MPGQCSGRTLDGACIALAYRVRVVSMLLPVSVEHGSPEPDGRAFHVTRFVVHFLKELVDRGQLFRVNIRREGVNVRVFHGATSTFLAGCGLLRWSRDEHASHMVLWSNGKSFCSPHCAHLPYALMDLR